MATSYTTNLGLALPVTSELAGTWGDVVNQEITSLLDNAIAGTTTLSTDADVTLTDTDGAANQSRQAILLWTANGTVTRTITAPARTKAYIVINATAGTQSIKLVGAGPTMGITLVAGEKCVAAWNGSDFVKVASSVVDGVTTISFGTTGLTPSTGTSGGVTVAGTLAVANGGTGQTTTQAAINSLAGAVTSGQYLRGNGTNVVMSAIQAADVPTLNQNTTGTASNVTGTVAIANGGTGQTTQTAAFDALAPTTTKGDLIVSNGTDNVRLAVGTNDYVLTADSTAAAGVKWAASAASPEIKTPTNVSPAGGATNIGETPALTGSTYYSLYGVAMAAGQWQVSTASDFSSTVVNTGDVAGTSVTYTVSAGILSTSTTYYWRVRYKDSNGVYSAWSTGTSFTTKASFIPVIGEAFGGGYYTGKIVQGGTTYYLIVAPKSSGENSSKQWKTTNDAGPTATQTLNNGPAASSSMNSSAYPAAQFCEGLSIGGYTDWYLPARDELELCYRNLKPTTDANNTSARSKSSYTYPEGNDVSGDTMGINRNSSPTGSAYTSSVPGQTSATDFKSGGTEAFAAGNYWSSSEYDSTNAWPQYFSLGYQGYDYKYTSYYVRAVRRVAV